ncbi:hypothetical protein L1987_56178 [Smallanthus sonchifolius]|uniref:Uncharacterized protein n=1 Tax=Smallanthus sonchifolius TaxID=185202 RepID=A0ACB9ECR8_9ASTR|nr:hypothetical protein L1987_56178 [Smallanthus sonchifolius]
MVASEVGPVINTHPIHFPFCFSNPNRHLCQPRTRRFTSILLQSDVPPLSSFTTIFFHAKTDFELSDAQQEHVLTVESFAPRLAALKIENSLI